MEPSTFWATAEPVLEEVFLSEVSTRVWCATLAVVDDASLPGELDPIARSVFVATLEVRRRALRLLLFARGLPGISTHSLNRLRRDCDSWTDQLLAQISPKSIAAQFCLDKRRFRELANHYRSLGKSRLGHDRRTAHLSGLRYLLSARAMCAPVCPELNADVCSVILGCLPASFFDNSGMLRPNWSVAAYQSDTLSFSLLADLCGANLFPPYDVSASLEGRR